MQWKDAIFLDKYFARYAASVNFTMQVFIIADKYSTLLYNFRFRIYV